MSRNARHPPVSAASAAAPRAPADTAAPETLVTDPGALGPEEAAVFDAQRPRLIRIAYRMLGSLAEAEDIVQDAWLRWHRTDRAAVRDVPAYLARIVGRLCLDHLKSARATRETYIGPWLPEPVIEPVEDDSDDLTLTLMMALERLSPLERAAFLLHDVFDVGFDEVAEIIERDATTCRQLAARARAHVRAAKPRYPVSPERGKAFATAFFAATRSGDVQVLQNLLAEDVVFYGDGGGKTPSVFNPIFGRDKVARFFAGLARKYAPKHGILLRQVTIDGLPGFIATDPRDILQTIALAIENDKITAIYNVRNPDKLRHVMEMVVGC